uniref:Protein kinase domain-containing protein n=1 Tax=Palpitomonas bilix TaxID=652834 RepID=A0A7S3G7X5_9EUKA
MEEKGNPREQREVVKARRPEGSRPAPLAPSSAEKKRQRTASVAAAHNDDTIFVRRVPYTRLDVMGRGGSSKVFKVMGPDRKTYALKKIRTKGLDRETVESFENEISLLKSLKGKDGIIRLVNYEIQPGLIYVVLELGEIDLARKLFKMREEDKPIHENFLKLRWQEMLEAVNTLHHERVVHSDLKPANFLFVEGSLKLIDFGIAKAISDDTTNIARDSQVGTLNYMSPEAIQGQGGSIPGEKPRLKVGRKSDIWSLGCILYQMVYGRTPFAHVKNFMQKLQCITDPRVEIEYPPIPAHLSHLSGDLLSVMKGSLERDVKKRFAMDELLSHPLLSGRGAGCNAERELSLPLSQVQAMLKQMHATGGLTRDLNVDDLMSTINAQVKGGREIDITETLSSSIHRHNQGEEAVEAQTPHLTSSVSQSRPARVSEEMPLFSTLFCPPF